MAQPIITADDVRDFIRDYADENPLIQGVFFNEKNIEKAMINTVAKFNTLNPPIGSYTVENFPYRDLLLLGTVAHLLRGAAVNQAVNQLTYTANGISVDDKNKAQLFTELGKNFMDEFRQDAQQVKINVNIALMWGTVNSEYIYRPRY